MEEAVEQLCKGFLGLREYNESMSFVLGMMIMSTMDMMGYA